MKITDLIESLEHIRQTRGELECYLQCPPNVLEPDNVINCHKSDCALHNGPALPVTSCDCRPALQQQSVAHEAFFVEPEEYRPEDGGWVVNIRTWPY